MFLDEIYALDYSESRRGQHYLGPKIEIERHIQILFTSLVCVQWKVSLGRSGERHTKSVQEMANKLTGTVGIDSLLQAELSADEMRLEHIPRNAIKQANLFHDLVDRNFNRWMDGIDHRVGHWAQVDRHHSNSIRELFYMIVSRRHSDN